MHELLSRLRVELPVVQAGMGGGIAGPELAGAVSEAGGLGTLGMTDPTTMTAQLAAVRRVTDKPVAVNLLLPFATSAHDAAAAQADVVVTFWGVPRRRSPTTWIHQAGSVDEVLAAHRAGADAVIVQGVEAGGHVRATTPALDLLAQARAAAPAGFPLLLAGGVADAADVAVALDAGAAAVVCGTRFLMSEESRASPGYKRRLLEGSETVLTELFGVGWPGAHRVLPNGATDRWLRRDTRGPRAVRWLNAATSGLLARSPGSAQAWMLAHQVVGVPFYSPTPPAGAVPDRVLETSPLYAGETVARIDAITPARSLVRDLARGVTG